MDGSLFPVAGVVQVQGNKILRSKDDSSDTNSATSHESTPYHFSPSSSSSPRHQDSTSSLDQHGILSSSSNCSLSKTNSVEKGLNEEVSTNASHSSPTSRTSPGGSSSPKVDGAGLSSVGEVTSGGMVILSKQLSQEDEQPHPAAQSSPAIRTEGRRAQSSPLSRKRTLPSSHSSVSVGARNGAVRMSLSEEVFVAQIRRTQDQGWCGLYAHSFVYHIGHKLRVTCMYMYMYSVTVLGYFYTNTALPGVGIP